MVDLRHKIEAIVGIKLSENTIAWSQWQEYSGNEDRLIGHSLLIDGLLCWPWSYSEEYVSVWELENEHLGESDRQFIELLLQTAANQIRPSLSDKENEEAAVLQLGSWLREQLTEDYPQEELPDYIQLRSKLSVRCLPFLLISESKAKPPIQYQKLNKLLKSYFGAEVLLIPIEEQEWMILVGEGQLEDLKQVSEESREAERAMLADLGQGIYELIASEWVGNFHVALAQPIIPEQGLTGLTQLLRETLILGKMFRVSEQIHLPWNFDLERLVFSIPDKQRKQFVARTEVGMAIFNDPETLSTLETFFQLDCNVSETAKRLYIHRNTLLYRMDKIKQETGLDVRSFKDAVLVKLTLLLYKVTKRK
jgi:hypothetical protein